MRLCIALSGTDKGRSGLGVYTRQVVPRIIARCQAEGGTVVVTGTQSELDAYEGEIRGAERRALSSLLERAPISALFHLALAGRMAKACGADELLMPAANRRAAALSPIPTVGVVHDLAPLKVRKRYDVLRMLYGRYFVVEALRRSTRLVAVSQVTAEDTAEAAGRSVLDVDVVLNGVDHERFDVPAGDPQIETARASLGLTRKYLLYVSRLEHPGKNHLRLLEAFANSALRQTHDLVLAGPDWGAESAIVAKASALGVREQLILGGFVDDEILPGLVAGADAVVMVGLYEGFGLPAMEALAAGRPVVASNTGALPEVVGDLGVLCDPLDEGSIRVALERVTQDEALRASCATEGPKLARFRSWDRTAERLFDICKTVAREGSC